MLMQSFNLSNNLPFSPFHISQQLPPTPPPTPSQSQTPQEIPYLLRVANVNNNSLNMMLYDFLIIIDFCWNAAKS